MNDLISRSKLIEDIEKMVKEQCMSNPNITLLNAGEIIDKIYEQPTVFDVDKVCEQLQENSVMMGTSKCAFDYPPDEKYIEEVVKIRTAFEIVERGGITNE